jgi:hypothetical protein
VPGEYSKYYTGEAYWALARLHLTFPREGWGRVADRIGAYLATKRDDVEDYFPPIEDHWAAYGLSSTVLFPERGRPPLTADELHYAAARRSCSAGRPAGSARGWGRGARSCAGPARAPRRRLRRDGRRLTGLWRTALRDPRLADLRGPMAERPPAWRALPSTPNRTPPRAAREKNPSRVEGAWFRDGETRMDDQQHALSALLRTQAIVRAGAGSGGADDETPAVWLWGWSSCSR